MSTTSTITFTLEQVEEFAIQAALAHYKYDGGISGRVAKLANQIIEAFTGLKGNVKSGSTY